MHHPPELLLLLSSAEATHGEARHFPLHQLSCALPPLVGIEPALHDREEVLPVGSDNKKTTNFLHCKVVLQSFLYLVWALMHLSSHRTVLCLASSNLSGSVCVASTTSSSCIMMSAPMAA